MKKKLSVLFILILLFSSTSSSVYATSIEADTDAALADYTYSITPDSENWDQYTVQEKVEMLSIPESKLTNMTDDELIAAIYSYPYLVDIYLYGNSVSDGIDVARTYFCALDELLSRETGLNSLYKLLSDVSQCATTTYDVGNQLSSDFGYRALWDVYFASSNTTFSTLAFNSIYTTTPRGTRVDLLFYQDIHTEDEHYFSDLEYILDVYPGLVLIAPGSCQYNCHYFAWHMYGEVPGDPYWMPDPSAYMTDGSYDCIYSGDLYEKSYDTDITYSDIIFYGTLDGNMNTWHSAIYQSNSSSSSPVGAQHCISKWGRFGVFDHAIGNVPAGYDTSHISAWRF